MIDLNVLNMEAAAVLSLRPSEVPTPQHSKQSIEKDFPSPEQLADPEDIFTLVWKTNRAMAELGLASATVRHYREEGLAIILSKHETEGTAHYSDEIIDRLVLEKRLQYEHGQTSRVSYQNLRKAAYWVQQMRKTGSITLGKVPAWGQRELSEEFDALLTEFCIGWSMAESSRNVARSAVRIFLFEMENHGYDSIKDLTQKKVNMLATSFSGHYTSGLPSAIYSVRKFLSFLFETGKTPTDLSNALPELVSSRKMYHEGFSEAELMCLLDQPDRNTPTGKRDYAMMVLAVQSGLRACDIVRLKLTDIDWRNREIRIVQHKTGQPLALPLETESGNAIADYILNGRPSTALPYIFPCHIGPVRMLEARSASAVVSKHMRKAGISPNRRAFHALRRTFGTQLLQNEVPFDLIQQLLGHTDMNSMKPYLSVDEQNLKLCALSLLSQRKAGC